MNQFSPDPEIDAAASALAACHVWPREALLEEATEQVARARQVRKMHAALTPDFTRVLPDDARPLGAPL